MTSRQYRYIKLCSSENLLRAETVSRVVTAKNLSDLTQTEADRVINFLEECYSRPINSLPGVNFDVELGKCLSCVERRSEQVSDWLLVLALLATNRVSTPGQLARYVFGVDPQTQDGIRGRVEPLLDELTTFDFIGCARRIGVPILGDGVTTDVYYLTEWGSEALHKYAPHVNYHARPGLPPRSRIQHELAVTEARLHIQTTRHIEEYAPESDIRSSQEKERRQRQREGGAVRNGERGSGDFCAWVVDITTGEGKRIEVEVTIRARQREIGGKPSRVKVWFAVTQHRCDLIELSRGEFAHALPDFRMPLDDTEKPSRQERSASKWLTVSPARLDKVGAALDTLGGLGTAEAVAAVAGLRPTTVSEALAYLADKGEVECRDGFSVSGKRAGRNLRLYHRRGMNVSSIFDFSRLLTASKLISTDALARELGFTPRLIYFDAHAGVMIMEGGPILSRTIVIVFDDPSDAAWRVAHWVLTAYRLAVGTLKTPVCTNCNLKDERASETSTRYEESCESESENSEGEEVILVTADESRAEALRAACEFRVVAVET
jgi:hypothetical protein